MKRMVIFYSRADENYFDSKCRYIEVGNTEKVAKMIGELTGAELFKIEQASPYAKDYYACITQAKLHKMRNARPEILAFPDLSDVDEVYLGYPNYWGTMPMAIYTLLEKYDWSGKTIHPFCTHEGSGLSNTEKDIAKAAKGVKVTNGLAIKGSHVDESKAAVASWVGK